MSHNMQFHHVHLNTWCIALCSQDVLVLATDVIRVCCVQTSRHGAIPGARGSNLMQTAVRHQGHGAYLHPAYSAEVPPEAAAHLQEAVLLWLAKYTNHPPQSSRGAFSLLINLHPAAAATKVKLVCSSFS